MACSLATLVVVTWLASPAPEGLMDGTWSMAVQRQVPEVSSLVLDGDTWYAGTRGAGVFRSRDRGRSWESFSNGLPSLSVLDLTLDPRRRTLLAAASGGIFRSSTLFEAFFRFGLSDPNPLHLVRDGEGSLWHANHSRRLFRSRDGGYSWVEVPPPEKPRLDQFFDLVGQGGPVLVRLGPRIWSHRGDDRGWHKLFDAGGIGEEVWEVARSVTDPAWIALGTETFALLTPDGGASWSWLPVPAPAKRLAILGDPPHHLVLMSVERKTTRKAEGPADFHARVFVHRLPPQQGHAWIPAGALEGVPRRLDVDPGHPNRLVVGGSSGVLTLEGKRLEQGPATLPPPRNEGLRDRLDTAVLAAGGGDVVALTRDGWTRRSRDGGRTFSPNLGRISIRAHSLVLHPDRPCTMATAGLFSFATSDDCGKSWRILSSDPVDLVVTRGPGGRGARLFAAFRDPPRVDRSSDFGQTWETVLEGVALKLAAVPEGTGSPTRLLALVSADGGGEPACWQCSVATSTDGGERWTRRPLPPGILDLEPALDASGDLLLVTTRGELLQGSSGGSVWTELHRPGHPEDLLVDPNRPEHLYVCGENGVVASSNGGRTWQPLGPPGRCRHLLMLDDALVVGTSEQVYRSGRASRLIRVLRRWGYGPEAR